MAGVCEGDKPLTLMRCHSYMKPLSGSLSVAGHTLEGFLSFVSLLL